MPPNLRQPSGLELEILDLLCMDAETAELLIGMLDEPVAKEAVRSCLEGLASRGLVRGLRRWYADESSEGLSEAYWWEITAEGRVLVESYPDPE